MFLKKEKKMSHDSIPQDHRTVFLPVSVKDKNENIDWVYNSHPDKN